MTKTVEFPPSRVQQVRQMANDRAADRLEKYSCPDCNENINLTKWACGSCGSTNENPDMLDALLNPFKALGRKMGRKPIATPLTGCGDKYCGKTTQNAILCPRCDTVLVFDKAAFSREPVVAKPQPALDLVEALGVLQQFGNELTDNAHQWDLKQAERDNELRRAQSGGTKEDTEEEPEWIKKVFDDKGFRR